MAETTRVISNLNDTLPAAPTGNDNIKWQINRGVTPPNISAYVPRASGSMHGTVIYDASGSATKFLGADGNWHDVPHGIPAGGSTNQVLGKKSADDYDVAWGTIAAAHSIPSGGATGQALRKNSATDYDASFQADPTVHQVPSGGSASQVLSKVSSTDYDLAWVEPASGGGYSEPLTDGDSNFIFVNGDIIMVSQSI